MPSSSSYFGCHFDWFNIYLFFKDCYYSKLKKYLFSLGLSIIIFITSIITANGLSYLSGNHHETSSRFQINKVIESIELFFKEIFS